MTEFATVTVDKLLHHIVIRQLDDGWYSAETVNIYLFLINRIDIFHLTVVIFNKIFFRHVEIHQTVNIMGEGFGKLNTLLMAFLIGYNNLIIRLS